MAKKKELELTLRILGKMDNSLTATLQSATSQVSTFSKTVGKIGTAGLAAMTAAAGGTLKAIKDCTEESANFRDTMADAVKYVDGMADATGKISDSVWSKSLGGNGKTYAENYAAMAAAIRDLSTQIPYTQEELAALAAAAGQSGKGFDDLIQYSEDGRIGGFLKDVAMVGTAMDITADQAGNWAAKWEKSMVMTHKEVMVLFDQINYLGANTPTTAAEIAEVVNGVAALGEVAGMDAASTAALADAMLATGVEASVASTSISRMLVNMSKGTSATAAQKAAWEELGFTAQGVAESMQTDATGTLLDVFEAINSADPSRQVALLNTLFGQWAIKGAAKLAGNIEPFIDALAMVGDPSLYEGSMEREFTIKSSTPKAVETMRDSAKSALMGEIGDAILPAKMTLDQTLIDFINRLRDDMPQIQELAGKLGDLASRGVEKLGDALEKALPYLEKALDYLLENGDEAASKAGTLAAVFAGMKFLPTAEALVKGAGSLLFGTTFSKTSSTKWGGLLGNGGIIDAFRMGAGMANSSMTKVDGETAGFGQTLYNSVIGGVSGVLNRKSIYGSDVNNKKAWENIVKLSGTIAKAKSFLPGVAKALGSGATTALGGSAVGLGAIAGGIAGALGIGSGLMDLYKGTQAEGKDAKDSYFSGGTKLGMVGAGAAAGAAIGSVVPVAGTAAGALIGAGIGGIGALLGGSAIGKALSDATDEGGWLYNMGQGVSGFFTETLPEKWSTFWSGVGNFFTESIPAWWGGVTDTVSAFFTETIPEKWSAFWNGVGVFFGDTVPQAIGRAAAHAAYFFTQTIPEKWTAMWAAIGNFFTVTIPAWAGDIWNNHTVPFFTETIPEKWDATWTAIGNFFTETIPAWAGDIWNNHTVPFFTETIPEKWDAMWTAIGNFFTETIPDWAGDTWNNHIVPFFTETIPGFFGSLWESVSGFFTGALPSIASSIWESIKSFFTETIPGFFGSLWESVTSWGGKVQAGYQEESLKLTGAEAHAAGGIFSTPHLGLVAEAGPESIIPLSAGERSRGLDLWAQTGRMLGVDTVLANNRNPAELKELPAGAGRSNPGFSVTFAPHVEIKGNADRAVVDQALMESEERFQAWLEENFERLYSRMERDKGRRVYA